MPHAATGAPKPAGKRDRLKTHRGPRYAWKACVFLLGLVVILACVGLWTFLPAPLAIPPMLIGVWIWSTEFPFAGRLLEFLKDKAASGRDFARRRPVVFGLITAGSFLLAAAAFGAFYYFS